MKKLVLLGLVVVLAVGGLAYLLTRSGATKIEKPFYKLASNIQQPTIIGNDAYFFTGSSFANLDLNSGKTKLLSSYFYTSGDITVSDFSKSFVIFGTSGTDANDQFGQTLSRAGLSPSSNAWWKYDFDKSSMYLIDFKDASSCEGIVGADDELYCSMPISGSSNEYSLVAYRPADKSVAQIAKTSYSITSLQSNDTTVYYLENSLRGAQSLHSYDRKSSVIRDLYKGKGSLVYGLSDNQIMLTELPLTNKAPASNRSINPTDVPFEQKLVLLDQQAKVLASKKIKASSGQINSSSNSLVFANKIDKNIYSSDSDQIKTYVLDELNDGSVWIIGARTYYIRGKDIFVNKKVSSAKTGYDFVESLNTAPNRFFVSESNNERNAVYVNDSSQDFAGNAMSVDVFLRSVGYDPTQFNFDWETGTLPASTTASDQTTILN